jgi:hypothetical protein
MARHDISQRRACRLVSVDPKTVRREPEPDNPEIRARMREVAGERRRFGYRRIGLMLRRDGMVMNHKKLRRLYREEGLAVIRHAVWLYFRFTLSFRDVEEMLAHRGIDVSYETVRCWTLKFGPKIAANLRRRKLPPSPR